MELAKIENQNQSLITEEISLVDEYRHRLVKKNKAEGTIREYMRIVDKFDLYMKEQKRPFNMTTEDDILDFIEENKGNSVATYNNVMRYIKPFFKFLNAKYKIHNAAADIEGKKQERIFHKKSINPIEIKSMFEYLKLQVTKARHLNIENKKISCEMPMRNLCYFLVLSTTGVRAGMAVEIQIKDIQRHMLRDGSYIPVLMVKEKNKSKKRAIKLSDKVFEWLEKYIIACDNASPENYLFYSFRSKEGSKKHVSYSRMRKDLNEAFKTVGVKGALDNYKVTPHSLRHTVGEEVVKRKGVHFAQHQLGHRSVDTTNIYVGRNMNNEMLEDAIDFDEIYNF